MILDSTYFIDLARRDSAAFQKGLDLFETGVVRRVPEAVLFEMFYGVGKSNDEDVARRTRNVLMGYPSVAADAQIARVAGEMLGDLDRQAGGDSGIEIKDAYVGATARVLGEPVLSRNEKHFQSMPGVTVETY